MKILILAATVAASSSGPVATAPNGAKIYGCGLQVSEWKELKEKSSGPLVLDQLSCVSFESSNFGASDAIVSPDGQLAARWHRGSPAPIEIAGVTVKRRIAVLNRVTFRNFGNSTEMLAGGPDSFEWLSNSKSLWAVTQRTKPSGFALDGLTPIRIGLDGKIIPLRAIHNPAGPLDGIQWVGNAGVALAQFGMRGSSYQPEHANASPTFAIIDAARGQVRASFRPEAIPAFMARSRNGAVSVESATATILRDGRVKALIILSRWAERKPMAEGGGQAKPTVHPQSTILWTEGKSPRTWRNDAVKDDSDAVAMSPDGSKLLTVRSLQPSGMRIFDCRSCPPPPPPTPVKATIAQLADIESGRIIWHLTLETKQFWNQSARPVISPDSHFALIEIPPQANRQMVALINMRTGSIMQKFSLVHIGSYRQAFGFSPDGKSAWITTNNLVARYRFIAK